MRRLYGTMMATTLLITLASGCGSTSEDGRPGLVLQFQRWDNTGIEQQDSVNGNSANIDVRASICSEDFLFTTLSFETFTETIINAEFRNNAGTDIQLQSYRIHFDDPSYGVGDTEYQMGAIVEGGRCSSDTARPCAIDTDCAVIGQATAGATCNHEPTLVGGILLFDFLTKDLVSASTRLLGRATSITVTFTGANANKSFETTASYVVTFDDFCNCPEGSFCVPPEAIPGR